MSCKKLVACLFLISLSMAWAAAAQDDEACAALVARCASMSDESFLSDAYLSPDSGKPHLGVCYFHDRNDGIGTYHYACDNYVKISSLPDPKGYNGKGTGCISKPDPDGKAEVAALLRNLCLKGACCCPKDTFKECPGWSGGSVKGLDPITNACCEFPNPCSLPPGWFVPPAGDKRCK
jgi:hypothetical protein